MNCVYGINEKKEKNSINPKSISEVNAIKTFKVYSKEKEELNEEFKVRGRRRRDKARGQKKKKYDKLD